MPTTLARSSRPPATSSNSSGMNSNGTATAAAARRPAGTSKLAGPSSTSSSSAQQFDLQACLDILKKLQPPISPDLPALFVTPRDVGGSTSSAGPSPAGAPGKRKIDQVAGTSSSSTPGRAHDADDSSLKRQRRASSSTTHSKDGVVDDRALSASSRTRPAVRSPSSGQTRRGPDTASSHPHVRGPGKSPQTQAQADSDREASATGSQQLQPSGAVVADDHISPLENLPSPASLNADAGTSASAATPQAWTKDRFRKIAASCREKGRALKHSGDRRMREYRPEASNRHVPILAILEQVDAVLLYAYAFYCEDQAIGFARSRQTSNESAVSSSTARTLTSTSSGSANVTGTSDHAPAPGQPGWKMGCNHENWKSIFGLLAFVRTRTEKLGKDAIPDSAPKSYAAELPRAMELVLAWISMLEALILQHLTTNLSRNLNSQASKMLSNSASPPGGEADSTGRQTPLSTSGSSSTSDKSHSSPGTDAFLANFMKLQSDLEKIHSQWPASQAVLLSAGSSTDGHTLKDNNDDVLSRVLRKGKTAYDTLPTKIDDIVVPSIPLPTHEEPQGPEDLFKDEENYFRFAWPVVLHHQNSVAHAASFGRALISEISERLSLGYQASLLE